MPISIPTNVWRLGSIHYSSTYLNESYVKSLLFTLTLLCGLHSVSAQSQKAEKQAPMTHYLLTDSTVVIGRLVRQDSSVVVIRKRGGDLTYIQPYQIVRVVESTYRSTAAQPADGLRSFTLKDGAVVYGRIVKETPMAVVVGQQNGTETYIDPGDILSTNAVTDLPTPTNGNPPVGGVGAPYLLNGRTAFTPGAGQVYYRNTYLIRNELEVGITNGWSAGVVVNPFIQNLYQTSEYLNQALYINSDYGTQLYTRVGIPIGKLVHVGAVFSAQLQKPYSQFDLRTAYRGTVLATLGGQQTNVTLGYSFKLFSDSYVSFLNTEEAVTIGTMISLSPSLTFISDNSIKVKSAYPGSLARLAAALRIKSRRHAFDVGVLSAVNERYTYVGGSGYSYREVKLYVYPYLGYNVQFGR
jgi:hypothetical protein